MSKVKNNKIFGFSLVEVILAVAIFSMIAVSGVATVLHSFSLNRLSDEEGEAYFYAQEGLEAVRSIKNQGWSNLTDGVHGLQTSGNIWQFSGSDNLQERFTRQILISPAPRDVSGNIIDSGGTPDSDTKKVTSTVNWNFSDARSNSLTLTTYLTNFRKLIAAPSGGGMLVYGNGGVTSDDTRYRLLDASTGTWEAPLLLDFDPGASDKALRSIKIDASATRNEKIAISRHIAGVSSQSIWSHVWNGSNWNSTQFSSWVSNSYTDVRNFDGVYLSNGNYLAVYSDNTSVPKYRIWDGSNWSPQQSLVDLSVNSSSIPIYIVIKARPNTNEVMAVLFGQARDTNTQYFNGSSWNLHSKHSNTSPAAKEMIDFSWSSNNPLKGAMVFSDIANDRQMNIKIWTADGVGGGSWTSADVEAPRQGILGALDIGSRKDEAEFIACNKDAARDIYCFQSDMIPSWSTPSNNSLTLNTDSGIQRSFDFNFEADTGSEGVVVYSDSTAVPKLKKYSASANAFDGTEVNLPSITSTLEAVRMRTQLDSDDIMILMTNTDNDLYTVVWEGQANSIYTVPSGKAFSTHGTSGSSDEDFWFDFAWDRF